MGKTYELVSASTIQNIPIRFRDKICMHTDPFSTRTTIKNRINCCAICYKPLRWYLQYCTVCKNPFIKDFYKYPNCAQHTKCWECSNLTNSCACVKDERFIPKPNLNSWDFDPVGLNPKKYSQEDLATIFDFDDSSK